MAQIHAGLASNGMAWFTQHQTAGKGQRGKSWETEPGKNIALSLALEPKPFRKYGQFYLSATLALACFDFFSGYAGDETKIKWPNDVYWRDRKAGGILIENIYHGLDWKWAVAGTGINTNQTDFDPDLSNPVSLKQITGRDHNNIDLAKVLYEKLLKRVHESNKKNPDDLMREYNRHLYKRDEKVKLKKEQVIFETRIKEVTLTGELITEDVIERRLGFGEIKWLL